MNNQNIPVRQYSFLRLFLVGLLLSTSLAVSVASRATVVKADTGEAAFGTPTQALQAAMSLGSRHTCVITNGNLLCWGDNTLGQLGNGLFGTSSNGRPTYVVDSQSSPTTPLAGVVGVIAATDHSCALINTGKVKCWGYGWKIGKYMPNGNASPYPTFVKDSWISTEAQSNASGDLTGVVGLAASTYNSCALINGGKVKCWGDDTGGGKLYRGTGYVLHCADDTFSVSCGSGSTSNVPISNIKSINMSAQSACAIKNDANLTQLCWGNTDAFGYDTIGENSKMYASSAHPGVNGARAFSLGQRTVCGLFEKTPGQAISVSGGQVKCWGMNGSKTLGRGDTLADNISQRYLAADVPGLDNAIAISGEMDTFCALLINRTVYCWGNNQPAKTGTGVSGFANGTPLPMRVGNSSSAILTDIYAVTVGADHVCIITGVTGNVKCSGTNTSGQLGDGSVTAKAVMTDVKAVSGDGNLEGAGADNMPPTLSSIAVNTAGSKVVLTYNELVSTSGSIPTGQFVVKVGGVTKTVSSVTVDGFTVELNMVERIAPGSVVRMSYTDPTGSDDTNIIEDASYNDAATISERDITNASNTEAVAPTLVSAVVNAAGTSLTLTYNEALNSTTAPTSAFAVTVGGTSRSVTGAVVSGSTVVLTLASAVLAGATVTVAYTAPTSDLAATNNAIQDTAGNDAASFNSSAVGVTNSSTFDNVSPVFQSAAVSGDKTKVVLTYNETLGATTAPTTAFVVQVNGSARSVTGVATSGSTVELTLASSVGIGQTVTVQYTAPTVNSGTSNNAIQDTAGNDALLIAALTAVANIEDVTAPTFVSGAVNTAGSLILTYSESLSATGPATTDMVVTVNGTAVTVSSVSIVGSTVVVVTSPVIGAGQAVTFRYTDPTAGNDASAIQDGAGNDAASSSSTYSVPSANNDSTVDLTAPTLVSGAVNTSGRLVLTYSEALSATAPATSSMVVTINGTAVTVSSVSIVGSTVVVVTSPVIQTGDVVTFRYTDPTTGNDASAIQDAVGNDVASSSSAYSVPGGSNASSIDTNAPTLVSGGVNSGGSLVLTYSEPLAAPAPATSSLEVIINGTPATVVSVTIVGSTVVVVTSPVIGAGDTVSFRYTDPAAGNDTNAIQDAAGNDVPSSSSITSIPGSGNASTQPSATTTTTTAPTTTNTTAPTTTTTTVPTTKTVDGDAPTASLSTSETQSVAGKSGKASFSDGSTFDVSKNGNLIPKLFTAYIGSVTGSVKVTYKSGKKTVSTTCSYGKYGSTKPKKVTKSVNGFFPKVFVSPKKTCLMPKAAIKALNTQLVTISANLKFVRLWPTTGKAKNPESGATLRPVNRKYSVKIGTAPK